MRLIYKLSFIAIVVSLLSVTAQAASSCKIEKKRYIKCYKAKKSKKRCKREILAYKKCRKAKYTKSKSKRSESRLYRTRKGATEIIVGAGFTNFTIDKIGGKDISSTPTNIGFSLGANIALPPIAGQRSLYVTPYVSSYSGSSYEYDSGNEFLESTTILEAGANIESRIKLNNTFYYAPFIGVKMKNIKATGAGNNKYDFEQNGYVLPIGINVGMPLSRKLSAFGQISIDAMYMSGEKTFDGLKTDADTTTGPGILFGITYKL